MSPILFKFAANIFLATVNSILHGITHPAQWQIKAIKFADKPVVGAGHVMDIAKTLLIL